jgi:SHS2 domain-containing protein
MKPFEVIEHTADIGLKVNGATLEELFENAAKGMFSVIRGPQAHPSSSLGTGKRISAKVQRKIIIKKQVEDFEELLVSWLSELLYIFNREKILFTNIRVLGLNYSGVEAEASGQKIDLSKTTLQTEIKAVTFHNLKIEESPSGFSCNIIFDV